MGKSFEQFVAMGGGWWCPSCQLGVGVIISETDSTSEISGEVNCAKCGLTLHTYYSIRDLERVGLNSTGIKEV